MNKDSIFNFYIFSQFMKLDNNGMKEIKEDAFFGMPSLEELSLVGNKIKEIDENGFGGLVALDTIYLQNNDLETLRSDIFRASVISIL